MPDKIRVAVVGAGRWSRDAHLPGFARSPLADLRVICDLDRELAEERQRQFDIAEVCTDYHDLLARTDIDLIDVCTRDEHEDLVFDVLGAGKHCLVEKPVAHRAEDVYRAQALAESRGLKTKVGLTFRYAPAVQYMYEMILDGFVGRPLVFNGYEQNSQWLDPDNPADKRIHKVPPKDDAVGGRVPGSENIAVHSLEGYGAPIIDISMLTTQSEVTEVVGRLKNLVPMRRRTNLDEGREAINMDDGDIYICEFANGAFGSVQSSYVTVGNYPGIEARIYGEKGAIIVRLVDEFGECETIKAATKDQVEFRELEIPARFFPHGYRKGEPWPSLFYANLVHNFLEEIAGIRPENQGNFAQSAKVQEIINAVEESHRTRSWVEIASRERTPAGER